MPALTSMCACARKTDSNNVNADSSAEHVIKAVELGMASLVPCYTTSPMHGTAMHGTAQHSTAGAK